MPVQRPLSQRILQPPLTAQSARRTDRGVKKLMLMR
jgi:hypothetical protein